MIGTRVEYRGSVEDAWGRYIVAEETVTEVGTRYTLATYRGEVVLRGVRAGSFTPIPVGPKHQVPGAQLRAQIVQGEFGRQYEPGHWLPDIHEFFEHRLPGRITDLLAANRPVEAESALLNAELFVGCIDNATFQKRMAELVVAGDDESWTAR